MAWLSILWIGSGIWVTRTTRLEFGTVLRQNFPPVRLFLVYLGLFVFSPLIVAAEAYHRIMKS